MNAPIEPQPGFTLDTIEAVMDCVTAWLRAPGKSRELKVEVTSLGLTAKLLERGQLQAMGRGTSADDAIAEALLELEAT